MYIHYQAQWNLDKIYPSRPEKMVYFSLCKIDVIHSLNLKESRCTCVSTTIGANEGGFTFLKPGLFGSGMASFSVCQSDLTFV